MLFPHDRHIMLATLRHFKTIFFHPANWKQGFDSAELATQKLLQKNTAIELTIVSFLVSISGILTRALDRSTQNHRTSKQILEHPWWLYVSVSTGRSESKRGFI